MSQSTTSFDATSLVAKTLERKYRIERLIGRGGMGAVFRSTHLGTGRPVAVKVLLPRLVDNPEAVERFRREALAAGALRHPNIVNVTDFGVADVEGIAVAYLVMEHLQGQPLSALIRRSSPLSTQLVADIVEQVALALEQAHGLGIVHRDLKPDNIWLSPDPRGGQTVRVLDFGIAKLNETASTDPEPGPAEAMVDAPTIGLDEPPDDRQHDPDQTVDLVAEHCSTPTPSASSLTTVGTIIGTPAYMSPEQISGHEVDFASDIYSLAIVTWEALTGRRPFEGDLSELVAQHRGGTVPPASSLNPAVSARVDAVLDRALSKAPSDRYPSTRAFAGSLLVAHEGPGTVVRKALSLYIDRLPLFVSVSMKATAWPLSVSVPLVVAAIILGLPFAVPIIVIGIIFVWALVGIADNGVFAAAVERHRFRPLEPFTSEDLFEDIAVRLGLEPDASLLRTLFRLTRTYVQSELRSPSGLGDLGFVVGFLERRPLEEIEARCVELAGTVRKAYGQIKAILFVILLVIPMIEGCIAYSVLSAIGVGRVGFAFAYLIGMALIPFNAVLLNPVFSIALTQLYYRARQANGEDIETSRIEWRH